MIQARLALCFPKSFQVLLHKLGCHMTLLEEALCNVSSNDCTLQKVLEIYKLHQTAMLTHHLSVLAMMHTASDTGSSTTECCNTKYKVTMI